MVFIVKYTKSNKTGLQTVFVTHRMYRGFISLAIRIEWKKKKTKTQKPATKHEGKFLILNRLFKNRHFQTHKE